MSYKIAWYMSLVFVVGLLSQLNGCYHDYELDSKPSVPVPTLSTTYVYTDNNAQVSLYGGMGPEATGDVQCPFTGKVVVTITPPNHATVWVFGPDQIDGADNCKIVGDGDLGRRDFTGTYNPKRLGIDFTSCVTGWPGDDNVIVQDTYAEGHVSCRSKNLIGNGTHADISATFNAKRSK